MKRRQFCQTAAAVAVAAAIPGCDSTPQEKTADVGSRISAISAGGEEISLEASAVKDLAGALDGRVLLQADEGYSAAKQVWNGMFDARQPAMVVRCANETDVAKAVNFARERDLLVSVKCGGHSLPGKSTSDGGMMIDLSMMHATDVDVDAATMRAGGGALLGHLDNAAMAHNLLTTTGIVSHTGAGGFTLGGGVGRTDRKMGFSIDNLLAATIVTASGDIVRASEDENPDLFWGIRGGGGNFGIATEFVYRLHPFNPTVYGGLLKFKASKDFLNAFAELNETLPDEANVEPSFTPPGDGERQAQLESVWCGDHAEGEKVFAALMKLPGYIGGELAAMSYSSLQTGGDTFMGHGRQYYLKSSYLKELTPESVEIIVDSAQSGGPWTWFQHLGGASSRVAPDAMAFSHRDVGFNFGIMYVSDDPADNEAGIAAVRKHYAEMEPHMAGFYTNLNDEDEQKTWGNYGSNYPRLVELKNKYDPTNMFRLNANIKPTA